MGATCLSQLLQPRIHRAVAMCSGAKAAVQSTCNTTSETQYKDELITDHRLNVKGFEALVKRLPLPVQSYSLWSQMQGHTLPCMHYTGGEYV